MERSPSVAGIAKVLLDALEVPGLVSVVSGCWIAVPVRNVQIQIVHRRRNPDGSYSHSLEIRHLLLNAGQVPAPIQPPIGLGGIKQSGALRRGVVACIGVVETGGHNLLGDMFLTILSFRQLRRSTY